jgi:hypothetical protein
VSSAPDSVRVHIASYNTASATELAIRSAIRLAGRPFSLTVGDAASTDGSPEMLGALARRRLIECQMAQERVIHSEWLDRWLRDCDAEYAVFADSDVEFRRPGWLAGLVDAARHDGADLVYAETLPGATTFIIPRSGKVVSLAPRPAPWLFLVRAARAREVGESFAEKTIPSADGALPLTYDVGGLFFRAAVAHGLSWRVMPRAYRRSYRHYGGLSWMSGAAGERKRAHDRAMIDAGLARERALEQGDRRAASRLAARAAWLRGSRLASESVTKARPKRVARGIRRRVDAHANTFRG